MGVSPGQGDPTGSWPAMRTSAGDVLSRAVVNIIPQSGCCLGLLLPLLPVSSDKASVRNRE